MDNWRKSTLKTLLEGCSWQWALEHVYQKEAHGSPATSMGTGFHSAMEHYEVSKRKAPLDELQGIAAASTFAEAKKLPMQTWFDHQTDPEFIMEQAREAVRIWWEEPSHKSGLTLKEVADSRTVKHTELWHQKDWPGSKRGVMGTMDALYEDDEFAYVVDYKTASSFRRWTYEQPPKVESALYLYMAQDLTDKPVKFEWHVVSPKEGKGRVIDGGTLTGKHMEVLARSIMEANIIYQRDAYRPNPEWNLCQPKWCSFYEGCRIDGTLTPYTLTTSMVPSSPSLAAPSEDEGQA